MEKEKCSCDCNCNHTNGLSNNVTVIFIAFLVFATLIISKAIDAETSKQNKEVKKEIVKSK